MCDGAFETCRNEVSWFGGVFGVGEEFISGISKYRFSAQDSTRMFVYYAIFFFKSANTHVLHQMFRKTFLPSR